MNMYIKAGSVTPEMLAYLGYTDIVKEEEGRYRVSRYGIQHPEITREGPQKDVAAALRALRRESGMQKEALGRRLLSGASFVAETEDGTRQLSDTELRVFSNVYQVKREALSRGVIERKTLDLEKELEHCRSLLARMNAILDDQIKKAESVTGNKRFFVKPSEDSEVYLIFDAAVMDLVREAGGGLLTFEDPAAALDAALALEQMRPDIREKLQAEKAPEAVPERNGFTYLQEGERLFVFEKGRAEPDGSDALVAVCDASGVTLLSDVTEKEAGMIAQNAAEHFERAPERMPDAVPVMKK